MSSTPSLAEALFADALAQPPAGRSAFLANACGADAALLAQLTALVAAHEASDSILDPPVRARGDFAEARKHGDTIGRYRLLEKIGEGGCGVVYRAEQQEPVRRPVALKVIKVGMDTHDVIARFEAERQALAMMDHPHIAKVLDAGATEAGRPYFVMELVAGTRITEYCDEHRLSTPARLNLFAQVCQAIQHAHQKGIIHRDIKPSNILVAEHDGVAVPKVIDFGIAKATHGRLTDRTVLTAIAQFIGTPVYMSPEQAELKGVDIDTRSDIYSLGVLLYELISGRPPFDPQTLISAGLDEVRRHIREIEPPRPSTRLSTLSADDRAAIAEHRATDPAKLSLLLRGDLDWIVMRCLEKDRARRYETANGLAMDIQRYLDDQPVSATPPSAAYRVKKLVWRHKFAFAAGGAFAVMLLAGTVVSTLQAIRATRAERLADARLGSELAARQEAEKQRQLALERMSSAEVSRQEAETQRRLAQERLESERIAREESERQKTLADRSLQSERLAREESERQKTLADQERQRAVIAEKAAQAEAQISKAVNDFLQDDLLRQADSRVQASAGARPDPDLKVREALDRAAARVEGRFGNRPLVEAGIRDVIGTTYLALGDAASAVPQLERALALRKAELGADYHVTLATMHKLAAAYGAHGRLDDATALEVDVLEATRRTRGPEHPDTLVAMTNLAAAYLAQGRVLQAKPLFEEALEICRRLFGEDDPRTLTATNNLAVILHRLGRIEEASTLFISTIRAREKVFGPEHPETLSCMVNLAQTHVAQGRFADAISTFTMIVDARKRALGPEHPDTLAAMGDLAAARHYNRDYDGAKTLLDEVIMLRRQVLGPEHPDTLHSLTELATIYWATGRHDDATALFQQTIDAQTRVLGPEHPKTITTCVALANAYRMQGRLDDAEPLLLKSVDGRRRAFGRRHHATLRTTWALGTLYMRQRKFRQAEEMLLTNCYNDLTSTDLEHAEFSRQSEVLELTGLLAQLYSEWGDVPRALQWRGQLLRLRGPAQDVSVNRPWSANRTATTNMFANMPGAANSWDTIQAKSAEDRTSSTSPPNATPPTNTTTATPTPPMTTVTQKRPRPEAPDPNCPPGTPTASRPGDGAATTRAPTNRSSGSGSGIPSSGAAGSGSGRSRGWAASSDSSTGITRSSPTYSPPSSTESSSSSYRSSHGSASHRSSSTQDTSSAGASSRSYASGERNGFSFRSERSTSDTPRSSRSTSGASSSGTSTSSGNTGPD